MKPVLFLLLIGLLATPASGLLAAQGSVAEMPIQSGGAFSVPVASLKDLRFRTTLHQQYDFSCGSAALATLLTQHYAYPVSEQEVFREMYERGDKAKIKKEGFSLLDIKTYLEAHGFQGDGFAAEIDELAKAGIPAIVLLKENGYHHFVVLKGVRNGRVLLGDPSAGTRAVPYSRFKEMRVNNILFVIRNKLELAKFNSESDWRVAPGAPLREGINPGIGDALLLRRGNWDF